MLLKKLVVAEDDDAVAHLVAATLGDAGFLCLRARDGEEALNLTRTEMPDTLVLDVMMPKMDGIEVCRRLKQDVLLSRIPILMLTSLAGVDDRVKGLEAGADDYLPKPFDLRELAARVKALIRQSRRERDRNPTTNLPGGHAIEEKVAELLKAGEQRFALLYIDIENFRSYADVYGFRAANEVVAVVGNMILQEVRVASDPPSFVGHVGGDDFIVICEPGLCEGLVNGIKEDFLENIQKYYTPEDQERGYLSITSDRGEVRRAQFMNPSIAIVVVEPGQFSSTEELASEVTITKSKVRNRTNSEIIPVPSSLLDKK